MKKWVFALCVGVALLALGARTDVNDSRITCGSETMYPGDVCEETRAGSTVDTKTYEEMKASSEAGKRIFNSWGRWALLGAGTPLTIAGIAGIVIIRRRRKAATAVVQQPNPAGSAGPAYPPPAQPNAPYVPPQGAGHYGPPQQYRPPQDFGPRS